MISSQRLIILRSTYKIKSHDDSMNWKFSKIYGLCVSLYGTYYYKKVELEIYEETFIKGSFKNHSITKGYQMIQFIT